MRLLHNQSSRFGNQHNLDRIAFKHVAWVTGYARRGRGPESDGRSGWRRTWYTYSPLTCNLNFATVYLRSPRANRHVPRGLEGKAPKVIPLVVHELADGVKTELHDLRRSTDENLPAVAEAASFSFDAGSIAHGKLSPAARLTHDGYRIIKERLAHTDTSPQGTLISLSSM